LIGGLCRRAAAAAVERASGPAAVALATGPDEERNQALCQGAAAGKRAPTTLSRSVGVSSMIAGRFWRLLSDLLLLGLLVGGGVFILHGEALFPTER
jgi:hypothetical protein